MTQGFLHIRALLICIMGIASWASHAQTSVSGIVVDSASLTALPSVSVQVKTGNYGTQTDAKGHFTIKAGRTDTLIFSLVGYQSLELPLEHYEDGIIRLSEKYTLLEAVTIDEYRGEGMYEGMFDERNAALKKNIPFYFSKAKKEKIKLQGLREENLRVQTYVDVVVNSPDLKRSLMEKYSITEDQYYDILTAFNERHYRVMYYLTRSELISMINTFYEANTPTR